MTNDEKIKFYDKIEKALKIEHPVIVYGLTRQQIIDLIKTMLDRALAEFASELGDSYSNSGGSGGSGTAVLVKSRFNTLGEFKQALEDTTYSNGDSISIGDDVYTLDRDNTDTPDDQYIIADSVNGNWVRNEGTVIELNPEMEFNLTVADGLEAWNNA